MCSTQYPYFSPSLHIKQDTVAHRQYYHINVIDILRLTNHQPNHNQGSSSHRVPGQCGGPHRGELAAPLLQASQRPELARAASGELQGASSAQGRNTTSSHSPMKEVHRQSLTKNTHTHTDDISRAERLTNDNSLSEWEPKAAQPCEARPGPLGPCHGPPQRGVRAREEPLPPAGRTQGGRRHPPQQQGGPGAGGAALPASASRATGTHRLPPPNHSVDPAPRLCPAPRWPQRGGLKAARTQHGSLGKTPAPVPGHRREPADFKPGPNMAAAAPALPKALSPNPRWPPAASPSAAPPGYLSESKMAAPAGCEAGSGVTWRRGGCGPCPGGSVRDRARNRDWRRRERAGAAGADVPQDGRHGCHHGARQR